MNLFENFKGKKNINFQKIKLIFNSIFYIYLNDYIFVEKSRLKLLSEPSVRGVVDTMGGPSSTCLKISREKKKIIFKKLNSILILYSSLICLPKNNLVFLIISPCLQQWLPIIIETSRIQCGMVIPQVFDENQWLFLILTRFLYVFSEGNE